MKVSEANKKICPFIQMSESEQMRDTSDPKNIYCITSDCMAWQHTETEIKGQHSANRFWETNTKTEFGYCKRLEL